MTHKEIVEILKKQFGYKQILVPEFTWKDLRIDAILIDLSKRWVRGFEIKTSREDFCKDQKWTQYAEFCSSLSIVCPEGLLNRDDIQKPFGLLQINKPGNACWLPTCSWIRRPFNLQKRNSLSWVWTYLKVLEFEMPRLYYENLDLMPYKKEALGEGG